MIKWLPIPIFGGEYSASDVGGVRHNITGRIFKIKKRPEYYPKVSLFYDGRYQTHRVHRLVALAHLGIYPDKNQVNHKDGDKTNNNLSNLEWVTCAENLNHAVCCGLRNHDHAKKKVLHNGEVYESVKKLAEILGLPKTCIAAVCRGQMKSYKGMIFKYYTNEQII